MDAGKGQNSAGFKDQKGCFVHRWLLILLIVVAAMCLLIVGLVVGYLAPCGGSPAAEPLAADDSVGAKPLPYVRLPRSVVPVHYDVELRPYISPGNFTFDGKVAIAIKVLERTSNVTLHANALNVTAVRLTDAATGRGMDVGAERDEEKQFLVLRPRRHELLAGAELTVHVDFVGTLSDQLNGFYRSSYKDKDGNTRWLATTQFQPTDARKAFPCFDEPGLKATFNITIVRWRNMTALSNMPKYKSEIRDEEWVADYFEKTVRMSTYLLAFVVSDFESAGTDEFSVWSREEVLNTTSYALDIGPKILRYYEKFFNQPYPLPKTDMVAIPDFSAGAMENWGLITYRETALLFDKRYSSASNKQRVATVVSHELAHQWFGNLVTPSWWDDLWLNEGFASYVEYLGIDAVHPDWRMDEQFVLEDLQDVMDLDCLRTSHPISLPVRHPDEINEIFDRISYGKGASIIRMMKYFLGDRNFHSGLSNYLNAKKFQNAVQDDLWYHLTEAQPKKDRIEVKVVMDSWTLQTGYPVVEVTRDYYRGTAELRQYRFLLEKDENTVEKNEQWEIPFTFTDGLNPDWTPKTKIWLHQKNGTISRLPGANYWVVGNVQQVGYYRVNYDEQNWKLLIRQMMTNHEEIHTVNRAQIIDDSLDLARAGLLSYHLALNTTLYLQREQEYVPWKAALNAFSFFDSMICRSAIYGKWKKYLMQQLEPMYKSVGWQESPNETILKQYMRGSTLGWMCGYGHKDCVTKAQELFNMWREDTSNTDVIPPNLRSVVMCTAVKQGGEEVWDFLWGEYQRSQVASEKDKFLYALACAKEPWLLTRYLNWSLTDGSGIRRQDGSSVFRSVGNKLYGRDLTFNYLRDKWDFIYERYGKSFFGVSNILKSVTSSLNTNFELSQLKEFYDSQQNKLGTAKRTFQQAIENTKANVKWMENYYQDLVDWLHTVTKNKI